MLGRAPSRWAGGEMAARIRAHPWHATPLGPMDAWPQSLLTAVDLVTGAGHAMQLAWGPARTTFYNDAAATLLGAGHPAALGRPLSAAWPELWSSVAPAVERVAAGESVRYEDVPLTVTRPNGPTQSWWQIACSPVRDETGTVAGLLLVAVDATPPVRVEGAPVWRAAGDGCWTWTSPAWTGAGGEGGPDSLAHGWLAAVHPADRDRVRARWQGAAAQGAFRADCRVRDGAGDHRWVRLHATPVRDGGGAIVAWRGTATDIDDLRTRHEQQDAQLAELQHRVRNILSVTRSIISRSDDGARSTEEYIQHLQGRVGALARTEVQLARGGGRAVDLEDLIRDELVAQVAPADRFSLAGADIVLPPKVAEVLTLAIHELATNATKYGAFARPAGRLAVRWRLERRGGQEWLVLDWTEQGVPIVDASPRQHGFGAELIERRIAYELKGEGSFELQPGGLRSRIAVPLPAAASPADRRDRADRQA